MECKRCRSGFPVLKEPGEKFCGFCGSSLEAVTFEVKGDDGPYYSDQKGDVRIKLVLKNIGVAEIDFEKIRIS